MSALTDTLIEQLNVLLESGSDITATEHRAFELQIISAIGLLESRQRGNNIYTGDLLGTTGPPLALGIEGDLFVGEDTFDFYTYEDGEWVFLFNPKPAPSPFVPVAANQYGTHPAFASQLDWNIWLTQHLGSGGGTTPVVTAPWQVPGVTATAANASAVVNWGTPSTNGGSAITNYTVKYRPLGASTYSVFGTYPASTHTTTITGLANGTQYQVAVFATNAIGDGALSAVATVTPTAGTVPAPTITSFTPTAGAAGSTFTITGTNFTGATVVSINSATVANYIVDSATQITAILTNSQATGLVRVTTPAGTAVSATVFTVASGNITPGAPAVAFSTSTRVLTATSATYAASELEVSQGGGTYAAYAPITVNASSHNANEWLFRVKAATGRNAGATAGSPAISAAGTVTPTYLNLAVGNSQERGDNYAPGETGDNSYPTQMSTLLPAGHQTENYGANGATWANINTIIDQIIEDRLLQPDIPGLTGINIILGEWANSAASLSAAQSYDACKATITKIRSKNSQGVPVRVFVRSPLFRNGSSYAQFNVDVVAITDRMRGDYGSYLGANGMMDVMASTYLDTAAKAANPAILADGTHPTKGFNQVLAHCAKDLILAGSGVQAADHQIVFVAPTIGGTAPTTTPTEFRFDDPAWGSKIGGGAWAATGSFAYCATVGCYYVLTYTGGIRIEWPFDAQYNGATLEFFKDGYTDAPVRTITTATGMIIYEDYPMDGMTHSVIVKYTGPPAHYNIFEKAQLWPY